MKDERMMAVVTMVVGGGGGGVGDRTEVKRGKGRRTTKEYMKERRKDYMKERRKNGGDNDGSGE